MNIKGTKKEILDDVNREVKLLGFNSLTLVGFMAILFLGSLILFFVNLLAVLFFVIIYSFVIMSVSKKFKEAQKKGIDNPIVDYLDSKSSYNLIEMKTTFIDQLYEREK